MNDPPLLEALHPAEPTGEPKMYGIGRTAASQASKKYAAERNSAQPGLRSGPLRSGHGPL